MDTLTADVPPTSNPRPPSGGDAARVTMPELGPGWLVLRNCPLGGTGLRVGLALLHPAVGVALVDSAPKPTDAADRLRRALDARHFPAIFGGYPPIVQAVLPADRSAELGRLLAAAFEAQPPLALAGGDAWIGTARAAIEAELPVAAPELLRARQRRASPWWRATAGVLAVVGVGSAAAVALVSALPGHRSKDATGRPAVVASAAAPGVAPGLPREAVPADDGLTALDVAAALTSAETAAAAGAKAATSPARSGSAPTAVAAAGGDRPEPAPSVPDTALVQQPQPGSLAPVLPDTPAAAPEPRAPSAGAAVASGPEDSGSAPMAAMAAASEERPEPASPAPVAGEVPLAPAASDPAPRRAPPGVAPSLNAAEPRPLPKRTAPEPADAPARTAAQAPATGGRRGALSAVASPVAEAGGGRCREILVRATMGGALSDGDKEFLRRGCQPRG